MTPALQKLIAQMDSNELHEWFARTVERATARLDEPDPYLFEVVAALRRQTVTSDMVQEARGLMGDGIVADVEGCAVRAAQGAVAESSGQQSEAVHYAVDVSLAAVLAAMHQTGCPGETLQSTRASAMEEKRQEQDAEEILRGVTGDWD